MKRIKFTEEQVQLLDSISEDKFREGILSGIVVGMAISAAITAGLMLANHYEFLFF